MQRATVYGFLEKCFEVEMCVHLHICIHLQMPQVGVSSLPQSLSILLFERRFLTKLGIHEFS